jgi:hypothetical protein
MKRLTKARADCRSFWNQLCTFRRHMRRKVSALAMALLLISSGRTGTRAAEVCSNYMACEECAEAERANSCRGAQAAKLPPNISAPEPIKRVLCVMLKRSPSFRQQCYLIGEAHHLQITIRIVVGVPGSNCRARSEVTRYSAGRIMFQTLLVAARRDTVEVIAHEFEHALEQIEGIDLKSLARIAGKGVYRLGDGSFETERAMKAGQRIAQEFYQAAKTAQAARAH